jgi:hypothetical protein
MDIVVARLVHGWVLINPLALRTLVKILQTHGNCGRPGFTEEELMSLQLFYIYQILAVVLVLSLYV